MKGWKEDELGRVANYAKEKIDAKSLDASMYVSTENMLPDIYGIVPSSYLPKDGKVLGFKKGDVLVSNIRPYFKKIWKAKYVGGCSNDILVFRSDVSKILPEFLYYQLAQNDFFDFMMAGANGVKMPRGNRDLIPKFKFQIPPLPTQKKIAGILSAYDDAIENNLRRIKLLSEMAQITYEEWFVRLRFPGHATTSINEATGLPEGWSTIPFGNKYKTASGGTPSRRKEDLYFKDGIIPWIRTQELRNNLIIEPLVRITEVGLKNSSAKIFPANTVLLAMYGNTIGETALLRIAASTNQACCAFLSQEYESYFIYQYLMRNKSLVLGYRMGAAQENISQEIIKSIKVLNPTDEIIRSYANLVRPIYDSIENFMRQNQRLREARDILLPRLMTGVIDAEKYQPEKLLKEIA
jgi:type I restriction enzyme S subunit